MSLKNLVFVFMLALPLLSTNLGAVRETNKHNKPPFQSSESSIIAGGASLEGSPNIAASESSGRVGMVAVEISGVEISGIVKV